MLIFTNQTKHMTCKDLMLQMYLLRQSIITTLFALDMAHIFMHQQMKQ